MYGYGLIGGKAYLHEVAWKVCDVLGNGANNCAHKLLIETCGAETGFGTYKDQTKYAGMGIMQFDKIGFDDVKARTREKHKKLLLDKMGIDIELVEWEHLRYNVVLSMVWARLKYKLVPEKIPETMEARSRYWKQYYNTEAGKGSVEHYIAANKL